MDWFLFDNDLRHERVKYRIFNEVFEYILKSLETFFNSKTISKKNNKTKKPGPILIWQQIP